MGVDHQKEEGFNCCCFMSGDVYSRDIVFPNKFQIEASEDGSCASITVSPLQQGFGVTVGNILRRTLLSSIRGVAIDKMKISGAVHEYTTIDGVKEAMTDIIYNLRRVVFTTDLDNAKLSFSVKGPKKVYASDIKLISGVKILNQKHFLFEITSDKTIDIELELCAGIGDIFVSQTESNDVGMITLDKHFSPVLHVNTTVRQTRVGSRTDYEKLVVDIKTNGSVSAEEAFKVAVSILTNFMLAIDDAKQKMFNNSKQEADKKGTKDNEFNYNLMRKIADVELSIRSQNCLRNANIEYIGDLVTRNETDMLRMPNFGRKSLVELKQLLNKFNLSFGMKIEWPLKNSDELAADARRYFENE